MMPDNAELHKFIMGEGTLWFPIEDFKDYIPLQDCIDGGLYLICARRIRIGVFVKEKQGFIGIRSKFGSEYLSMEYHWDTGEPCGTVKPEKFMEPCPPKIMYCDDKELFKWLEDREVNLPDKKYY